MRIHRAFTLCLAALSAVACDATRKVTSESKPGVSCVRCHGGEQDQSGAPPRDTLGRSLATLPSVGAHAAHVAAGIDCGACHVKPTRSDDGHIDGRSAPRAGTWGTLATANGAVAPEYDAPGAPARHTCASTYCHGAFAGGNTANAPSWIAGGPVACGSCHGTPGAPAPALPRSNHPALAAAATHAACAECHADTVDATGALVPGGPHVNGIVDAKHPAGWADPASPAFHGISAGRDPLACDGCHARRPPASPRSTVTCADCHLGGAAWTTTCNGCHGQGDPRGVPPPDVDGDTAATALGVGAHRRHVDGSAVSGPLGCVFCHRGYDDAYDAGHLDGGAVKVTAYTGADAAWLAALGTQGWNRSTATCAASYCHSAYAPANAPVWTAPRASACGTCHGVPPGGIHPPVGPDVAGCSVCHAASVAADGGVKPAPAGAHLNGRLDATGGHVAAWMDTASPEFHAFAADRGLASCQSCHGQDLGGGFTGVACAGCHDGVEAVAWGCTMCHGGTDNQTGAPPKTIWGYGADAVRTGGHTAHVEGGALYGAIGCGVCHVVPADVLSAGHVDTVTGSAVPTASVAFTGIAIARDVTPSTWDRATPTCSVYCHGAAFPADSKGSNTAPDWAGGPGEAACGSCHGNPPGGTHPTNRLCGSCHDGYTADTVNLATHIDGTPQKPQLECHSCHGDPSRTPTVLNPQLRAAPPVGTNGESTTTSRGVGAHQLHLVGGDLSDGLACTQCHAVPSAWGGASGHPSGAVELSWGALATANGTLSPAFAAGDFTCSATYCHGGFPLGNPTYRPTWTNPAANACGTCHGSPAATAPALPVAGHAPLAAGATNAACAACHPDTVDPTGAIVVGGRHVDGQPQTLDGAKHPAGWADPDLHGAAAAQSPLPCQACHAVRSPAAVTTVTCADCHAGGDAWTTTCNGCHGSAGDPSGAPPADVPGNTEPSSVGVGAHQRHVRASSVSGPLDCVFCHVKPTDAYDPDHLDGGAVVVTAYTGTDPDWILAGTSPGWDRPSATCSTSYCHGAFAEAGAAAPVWTAPRADACGTCHGLPPTTRHPVVGPYPGSCNACHSESIGTDGLILAGGAHLDGRVSVTSGHPVTWMDAGDLGFHAYAANRGLSSCQGCHGQELDGGAVRVSCASCHDGSAAPSWGCTACHGGTANPTGAPPKALWGHAGDPERGGGVADAVRVGGHTAHVDDAGLMRSIDCGVCHVKPASILSAGHIDELSGTATPLASVVFSGIAAGATPWDRSTPTCTVYCHGSGFSATSAGTNTTPSWTGGPTEATCGSCHLAPPLPPHSPNPQCGSCHDGYTDTSVNLATHVDGIPQVPALDCFSCHGDRARPATALNPMLPAAPPVGTRGETDVTDRAVGAHQRHLLPGALSEGFACTECHDVPADFGGTSGHPSGAVELKAIIGATGSWNPADRTCSATYCHGNFDLGDASNAPIWNEPAAEACGTCHGGPPPLPHPDSADCGRCHPGYTATTVVRATHVNGELDANLTCSSCHGDATRVGVTGADPRVQIAPPVTASGRPAGAHLAHVNRNAVTGPVQCAECHQGAIPTALAHSNGARDVAFGGRATSGGAAPSYDATSGCSATYCHGNYSGVYTYTNWSDDAACWSEDPPPDCLVENRVNYAGNNATPRWTDGPTTCGSCHGNPPPGPAPGFYWHGNHGNLPQHRQCELCHPDATGTNATGGTAITNPSLHMNGVVDVKPSGSCGCH